MKKGMLIALAVVMVLILSMPVSVLAGQVFRSERTGAYAQWIMYDESTGIYTEVYIHGHEAKYHNPPGRPQTEQYIGIQIVQYQYWWYASITEVWYWGNIPAGCLSVDQRLGNASLVVQGLQAWKWDYETWETIPVTLDLNISWTATGPLTRDRYHWHYRSPHMNVNYRYSGKSRQATAQGSVCHDGTNIILGASDWSGIFSAKDGQVVVNRQ